MNTQKSVVNGIYRDVQAQKVNGRILITNLNGHELANLEILSHNESEILEVLQIYRDDKTLKQSFWKGYGMSSTAIAEAYVKDSYRFGRDSLLSILTDNLIETGYTVEFLKKIETFSFENTSAVLYKNVYITPKMLEVVIKTAIEGIQTQINNLGNTYATDEELGDAAIKDMERFKDKKRDLRINNKKLRDNEIYFDSTEEAIARCVREFNR